jgi:hypothetical protein
VRTIVVLDGPKGLVLDNFLDAAGSGAVPTGAPATGLGGTALSGLGTVTVTEKATSTESVHLCILRKVYH